MRRSHVRAFNLGLLFTAGVVAACDEPITIDPPYDDSVEVPPSWELDVAPLFAEHCNRCHSQLGIAPFELDNFEDASAHAAAIAAAVVERRMPPFGVDNSGEC